jgi:hypothetical protein
MRMPRFPGYSAEKSAALLLSILLLGDLVFITIHLLHILTPYFNSPSFNIEFDNGYGEKYQYLKYLVVICLFIWFCSMRRTFGLLPWALLFGYFLADDAWQMHERLGAWIGEELPFAPPFRLRRQDLGELLVTTTAGLILLPSFLAAYFFGPRTLRKTFHDLLLLLSLLMGFAVGVDMVHAAFLGSPRIEFVLGVIEDGGELIAVSLLAWYAYFLTRRRPGTETTLLQMLMPANATV